MCVSLLGAEGTGKHQPEQPAILALLRGHDPTTHEKQLIGRSPPSRRAEARLACVMRSEVFAGRKSQLKYGIEPGAARSSQALNREFNDPRRPAKFMVSFYNQKRRLY
ncbi:hypothetical protein V8C86DRAFT_2437887 [Haematococcus lacustris]